MFTYQVPKQIHCLACDLTVSFVGGFLTSQFFITGPDSCNEERAYCDGSQQVFCFSCQDQSTCHNMSATPTSPPSNSTEVSIFSLNRLLKPIQTGVVTQLVLLEHLLLDPEYESYCWGK